MAKNLERNQNSFEDRSLYLRRNFKDGITLGKNAAKAKEICLVKFGWGTPPEDSESEEATKEIVLKDTKDASTSSRYILISQPLPYESRGNKEVGGARTKRRFSRSKFTKTRIRRSKELSSLEDILDRKIPSEDQFQTYSTENCYRKLYLKSLLETTRDKDVHSKYREKYNNVSGNLNTYEESNQIKNYRNFQSHCQSTTSLTKSIKNKNICLKETIFECVGEKNYEEDMYEKVTSGSKLQIKKSNINLIDLISKIDLIRSKLPREAGDCQTFVDNIPKSTITDKVMDSIAPLEGPKVIEKTKFKNICERFANKGDGIITDYQFCSSSNMSLIFDLSSRSFFHDFGKDEREDTKIQLFRSKSEVICESPQQNVVDLKLLQEEVYEWGDGSSNHVAVNHYLKKSHSTEMVLLDKYTLNIGYSKNKKSWESDAIREKIFNDVYQNFPWPGSTRYWPEQAGVNISVDKSIMCDLFSDKKKNISAENKSNLKPGWQQCCPWVLPDQSDLNLDQSITVPSTYQDIQLLKRRFIENFKLKNKTVSDCERNPLTNDGKCSLKKLKNILLSSFKK